MSTNAPSRFGQGSARALQAASGKAETPPPRLLITAGPTREPIDSVRFIGNRSSGRLGIELAMASAGLGWATTLLLGPTPLQCNHSQVNTLRFSTTADLESLLELHAPHSDCLLMAAAVADYRPSPAGPLPSKVRRKGEGLMLRLEVTPDLLAGVARRRQPGQFLVGFALEPLESLLESAMGKLIRKQVDLIVANPLETMDSDTIEATLIERGPGTDAGARIADATPGLISKADFACWLLGHIARRLSAPEWSEKNPPVETTE